MKRCRNRQRQGALGAVGLEHFTGLLHRPPAARDDGLHRVVEIDGLHHLQGVVAESPRRFCAASYHFSSIQAQNRRHRTDPDGHSVLHGLRPKAHQGRGLGGQLLRRLSARADAAALPVYLETDDPNNVPLYERFGYRVLTAEAPASLPTVTMWRMQREAASAAGP